MVEDTIISVVKRYLKALESVGIHAHCAVLFGSFAKGRPDEYSDIDLIVIAPEFDGSREFDKVKNLWRTTVFTDNRIEPIPCGEKEWETDRSRPILEIARREGMVISN